MITKLPVGRHRLQLFRAAMVQVEGFDTFVFGFNVFQTEPVYFEMANVLRTVMLRDENDELVKMLTRAGQYASVRTRMLLTAAVQGVTNRPKSWKGWDLSQLTGDQLDEIYQAVGRGWHRHLLDTEVIEHKSKGRYSNSYNSYRWYPVPHEI